MMVASAHRVVATHQLVALVKSNGERLQALLVTENAANDVYSGMNPAPCKDYNPGEPLVSKTAEIVSYTKGSCSPTGGELKGDLMLAGQVTVCCFAATM